MKPYCFQPQSKGTFNPSLPSPTACKGVSGAAANGRLRPVFLSVLIQPRENAKEINVTSSGRATYITSACTYNGVRDYGSKYYGEMRECQPCCPSTLEPFILGFPTIPN